jgi:hypothetical protein
MYAKDFVINDSSNRQAVENHVECLKSKFLRKCEQS